MSTVTQVQAKNQSKENVKIESAFDNAITKGIALVKDPSKFKSLTKIPQDRTEALVEEFFGEELEALEKEFKTKFGEIIKGVTKFNTFAKEEQLKFDKIILEKKKEFTKQMNDCFSMVENIDNLRSEYVRTLSETSNEVINESTDQATEEETTSEE